jgi:hypothetical protein
LHQRADRLKSNPWPTNVWWLFFNIVYVSIQISSYLSIYKYIYISIYTGWLYTYPSEKYESQWEGWHPIYEMENKSHVPNHQPDIYEWFLWVQPYLREMTVVVLFFPWMVSI